MKTHKPTAAMRNASKQGLEMLSGGDSAGTSKAIEIAKKISSGQNLSDDHINDMAHFHSSHDECPKDCEDLLWGGPAGDMWAKNKLRQSMSTVFAEENIDFNSIINNKDINLSLEIFSDIKLDEPTEETDDGLIWAPIARSGTLATRPGPNGEKLDQPLIFIPGHSKDQRKEIGLRDVYDAFKDGAIEHVTIPLSHENNVLENTGFIRDLKIVDSNKMPGEKVLLGAHEFTEPDVKGKVERGTIPSRSCGFLYDYKNTTTGKEYPIALDHTCLTPKPWMGGMASYGSSEFSDTTTVSMMLSEKIISEPIKEVRKATKLAQETTSSQHSKDKKEVDSEFLADIQWGGDPSYKDIENQINSILDKMSGADFDSYPQYYCIDCKEGKALVKVNYGIGPDEDAWVAPYTVNDQQIVELSPFQDWIDVARKWVSDTVDPVQDKEQLDRLKMGNEKDIVIALYLDVSQAERDKAKSENNSLPDGSYPIRNTKQLHSAAVLAASKHGDYEAAKRLIRRRAKELGVDVNSLPGFGSKKESSTSMSDPLKVASARRSGKTGPESSPLGGSMTLLAMSEEQMERLGLSEEAKEHQRKQNNEIEKLNIQLAESQKAEKETRVANRISALKDEGFNAFPGLLKEIETTLLSDDGDVAVKLQLSEHGHEVSVPETATQLVERFIKAIPRKDGKVDLGEFANKLETPMKDRPTLTQVEADGTEVKKTTDQMLAEMEKAEPSLAKDPAFAALKLSENGKGK